ncbi:MAG: ABC transporter substrate-binding protein [Cyanobacteria bacterium]|nr:ABC transporter substrate-binding protein [Cyanobacteriota bacterium]MDW8200597.1 ABC transporter substrate-binding protein [Cyanobacteriota bacterium SKYGB_h_bin112]
MVAMQRWMAAVGAIVLSLALVACSPYQFRVQSADVPEIIIPSASGPSTFNPVLNTSFYSVNGFLHQGMLTENGLTAEIEPALAESWQISEDKRRVTFTLREGLKWSDGQPLTVDDVVFTFRDVYLNPKIESGGKDILRVGLKGELPTVAKVGDRQIEFTIPEPFAPFVRFVGGVPILPAHVLKDTINTTDEKGNLAFLSTWSLQANPREIVGAGAYVMERYVPGQRIILRRNPYYWRKDQQGNPQPYIERIVWQIIESSDSQIVRFRSNELDTVGVPSDAFQLVKRDEKRGRYKVYNGGPERTMTFVSFNLNRASNAKGKPFVDPLKSEWFNTKEFRQAVAYSIDRERIKQTVFRGLAELQNSPIYFKSPYFLSAEQGIKVYNYDPEKAKALLKKAGFRYNSNGELEDAKGNRVEFTILVKAEEKSRVDMMNRIRADLSAIGIKANPQVISFNSILEKLKTRDWECYVGKFAGGSVDPHSGFNIWYSQGEAHQFNQGQRSGEPPIQNWQVSDWEKDIDRLMIAASQELDEAKRRALYVEFQQLVQEQVPFIYLVNELNFEAVRDRIQNLKFSALGGSLWNLYELKVK